MVRRAAEDNYTPLEQTDWNIFLQRSPPFRELPLREMVDGGIIDGIMYLIYFYEEMYRHLFLSVLGRPAFVLSQKRGGVLKNINIGNIGATADLIPLVR